MAHHNRRPLWLNREFWALLLVMVAPLIACGQPSTGSAPTSTPVAEAPTTGPAPGATPTAVQAAATPTSAASAQLTIGSTGETAGLKVTLNSVRHETSGNIPPKAGMEYLVLNLTFENVSGESKAVSSLLDFSVKDDTGQKYTVTIGAKTKSSPDGKIAPGDKLRGESAFEVPVDARGLVFIFDPLIDGEPLRFKLDR